MTLTPGTRLGVYEISGQLGAGGMGEVYRARDTRLDRDVALKVLPTPAQGDRSARSRLVREAKLAASLNHPAVCTIHDVGEDGGRVYVAMELVPGRRLSDIVAPEGLPIDRAVEYGAAIADALAHAHALGVVHRDLKPANVIVGPDGRVKVLDFGLAARLSADVEAATRSVVSLDSPGVVSGTMPYMAPEALRGAPADPRSDVWSFGVVLYEMIAGRRPFDAATGVDLTSAIIRDRPAPLGTSVPPAIAAIVDRCLQKNPEERYADAGQARAALGAVAAGSATSLTARSGPTRRIPAAAAATAAIFAIVAAVVAGIRMGHSAPAPSATTIRSLAVLPLDDQSAAAGDYVADGIAAGLTDRLSRLPGLTVVRASNADRKSGATVAERASQLNVQAIVTGTLVRASDRVRVTARLVDPASGASLWTQTYERALSDAAVIEADAAAGLGAALGIAAARGRTPPAPAPASEAYDLYLRGRYQAGREDPDAIAQAIAYFERAVAADPQFAAAHAELARAYAQRLFYVTPGDQPTQERAFVAVERALALDPDLDSAHLARGLLLWQPWNHFPHDRAAASYRRALALNPNSDEAHHQLGMVYLHVGLLDEAAAEIREAVRLNPSNTLAQFRIGVAFLYQGRYAEARDVFAQVPNGFQTSLVAFQLADAQFHLGQKDDARRRTTEFLDASPRDVGGMSTAMRALYAADSGDSARLDALVAEAQEKGKGFGHFHHTAFTIARAYALAGRAGEAVDWLRRSADDGYPCYPVFAQDTALDRIRGEKAFKEFLDAQHALWESFKQLAHK